MECDAIYRIYPRKGTRCPKGCAFRKPLMPKRFLQLSTEVVHRYYYYYFYIQKK